MNGTPALDRDGSMCGPSNHHAKLSTRLGRIRDWQRGVSLNNSKIIISGRKIVLQSHLPLGGTHYGASQPDFVSGNEIECATATRR